MTGSMIEVDRIELVKRLRAARERVVADNAKATEAYRPALDAWKLDTATKLEVLAGRLRDGRSVRVESSNYHGGVTLGKGIVGKYPNKPNDVKSETCRIDRMIATIELVKAPTFKLRTDDPIIVTALGDAC